MWLAEDEVKVVGGNEANDGMSMGCDRGVDDVKNEAKALVKL